jgi:hypothetical protein
MTWATTWTKTTPIRIPTRSDAGRIAGLGLKPRSLAREPPVVHALRTWADQPEAAPALKLCGALPIVALVVTAGSHVPEEDDRACAPGTVVDTIDRRRGVDG